jgi:hypothetical protein
MHKLPAFLFFLLTALSSFFGFSQEGDFAPTDISFDLDKLKQLDFGSDSLDPDIILFRLFPAPMKMIPNYPNGKLRHTGPVLPAGAESYILSEMTRILKKN